MVKFQNNREKAFIEVLSYALIFIMIKGKPCFILIKSRLPPRYQY